jgi:uncharacterized protein with PIN domain
MLERFAADRNLGKLAKWLRILGYDTLYDRNDADRDFLRRAGEEGRIALTRKRELAHRVHLGPLVVVKADHVEGQLSEVITALDLEPDPSRRMARCLNCNAPLEEVPKASLEGLVPIYVFGTCTQFRRCPLCKRIFWPGTHSRHVEERLSAQFPHRDLSF